MAKLLVMAMKMKSARLLHAYYKRITRKNVVIDTVKKLVRYQCSLDNLLIMEQSQRRIKRLANKLAPQATIKM